MTRLWTTDDVIQFLAISKRKFAYLRARGAMVAPVAKIGRRLLFIPAEVRAWVESGCPLLAEWEAIKRRNGLSY
jgi:hypothetical protein